MEIIGKKCVVRCDIAGVFYGTIASKENTPAGVEVELKDCRRLWYWDGACSLSQLATEGVKNPGSCKFTVTVPTMAVMQVIEILPCTEVAINSIEGVKVWKRQRIR